MQAIAVGRTLAPPSPGPASWAGRAVAGRRQYVARQLTEQLRPELEAAVKRNDSAPGEAYSPDAASVRPVLQTAGMWRVWAQHWQAYTDDAPCCRAIRLPVMPAGPSGGSCPLVETS